MLAANEKHLQSRWPQVLQQLESAQYAGDRPRIRLREDLPVPTLVVDDIHLSSCYDPVAEASLLASGIPEGSEHAYLYGIGTGQLPLELLRRDGLKRLDVVLMNPQLASAVFTHFDCSPWLSDPRIELQIADEASRVQFPFAAMPSCLRLASKPAQVLADTVLLEMASPYIKERFEQDLPEYLRNIAENAACVAEDPGLSSYAGRLTGKKVIVAGAGPTLANSYEWILAQRDEYYLVAVDTASRPLVEHGIVPDAVVCADGSELVVKLFDYDLQPARHSLLVYLPIVNHRVVEKWPGPRLVAYTAHHLYDEIRAHVPRENLYISGTVLHAATDFAVRSGATEVLFVGADFSYPNNMTHVSGAAYAQENVREASRVMVENGHGEEVPTAPNLKGFLRDLEAYILQHPQVSFYNTCRDGARIQGTRYLERCGHEPA